MSDQRQSFYNENGTAEEVQKRRKKRNKKKKRKGPGLAEAEEGGKEMEPDQGFSVNVEGGSNHSESDFTSPVGQQVHFTLQGGTSPEVTKAEVAVEKMNGQDDETLVVEIDEGNAEHVGNLSTTETTTEVAANIDVDDLPEDIRARLLGGEHVKTMVVTIDGEQKELPVGMTVETLEGGSVPDDFANLLPGTEGGGNVRVLEYTETILSTGDDDEEYGDEDIIQTVIIRKGENGEDIEEIVTGDNVSELHRRTDVQNVDTPTFEVPEDAVIIGNLTYPATVDTNVVVVETETSPATIDTNVVVETETYPATIDNNVDEIVTQIKRVRTTKTTKTRRVIITRNADGEEIETVVEGDDDDSEIDGEIDTETHVQMHTIIKKRRVIITKLPDGSEVETVVEDDDEGDDSVENKMVLEVDRKFKVEPEAQDEIVTVVTETQPESAVEFPDESKPRPGDSVTVQFGGFMPSFNTSGVDDVEKEKPPPDVVSVTQKHYIIHKDNKDDVELTAHLHDITHEKEDKVELEINIVKDVVDEDILAPVETQGVESEVDLEAILGPPDEDEEPSMDDINEDVPSEEPVYIIEADVREVVIIRQRKIEEEEVEVESVKIPKKEDIMTVQFRRPDIKKDEETVRSGEVDGDVSSRVKVNFEFKTNEPVPDRGPEFTTKLTEEQRRILDSVTMESERSLLDEWVLVKFTQKEIQIFVDLMRYRPGYLEKSMEQFECCNVM